MRHAAAVLGFLGVVLALTATPVAAHPLGNFTVNRAVTAVIGADAVAVRYIVDMAEIPAFTQIATIDGDGDGTVSPAEGSAWAEAACLDARDALRATLDGHRLRLTQTAAPDLAFPTGAGGLETLRLICHLASGPLPSSGTLAITDAARDERPGWHEVTISAGEGVEITTSTVPAVSASAELTSYPGASLESPPDVRTGSATFRAGASAATTASISPVERDSRDDPLAGLLAPDTAPALGLLVAVALGMAHALSPGHGKALVAAYLVGSRGTVRQATVLGLTVAVTHTIGVFVLGVVVLAAGQWLVPDRFVGWLSVVSGVVVVALGLGLLLRVRHARDGHPHPHPHLHSHQHHAGHDHVHGRGLRARELVALGFAGGLVPSASALIVLLVAISTGRLAYGAGLIVAFGIGMALVLAGLAAATTLVHRQIAPSPTTRVGRVASRLAPAVPVLSAGAVLVAGIVVVIRALPALG